MKQNPLQRKLKMKRLPYPSPQVESLSLSNPMYALISSQWNRAKVVGSSCPPECKIQGQDPANTRTCMKSKIKMVPYASIVAKRDTLS